jgi:hypothetical protein
MLLLSDPEGSVNASFYVIFRLSISGRDKASATTAIFFYYFMGGIQMLLHILQRSKNQGKARSGALAH